MFKVPEKYRNRTHPILGSDASIGNCGLFEIPLKEGLAICIASNGCEWRPVVGYDGLYEVSNFGGVRSVDRYAFTANGGKRLEKSKELFREVQGRGYFRVSLSKLGVAKKKLVHVLVAEAFIENPFDYPVVNHIDGNPSNCMVDNLEWCTTKHNNNHAIENGLSRGLTWEEIEQVQLLLLEGKKPKEIAEELNFIHSSVKKVKQGKSRQRSENESSGYTGLPFWEHVSVHMVVDGKSDVPTWEEMCEIKAMFWNEEDCVVQFHPPKSEYVNRHPHTLHLWRQVGKNFPTPPMIMV